MSFFVTLPSLPVPGNRSSSVRLTPSCATILKWHKHPGDAVRMDETVLEIATDKVDSEVPSTEEGVIQELLFKENDVVPVGATIARIKTSVSEAVNVAAPEYNIQPQEEAEIFVHSKSTVAI